MAVLTVIGFVFVAIVAFFLPRTILCIVAGTIFGGAWWLLFGIGAIISCIIDFSLLTVVKNAP